MKEIDSTTAKRQLGRVLSEVMTEQAPQVITRNGRPVAVLVPHAWFVDRWCEDAQMQTDGALPVNSAAE